MGDLCEHRAPASGCIVCEVFRLRADVDRLTMAAAWLPDEGQPLDAEALCGIRSPTVGDATGSDHG